MVKCKMMTNKNKNYRQISLKSVKTASLIGLAALTILGGFSGLQTFFNVQADSYDEQIEALKRENQAYNYKATEFREQAATLKGELAKLDGEKKSIQEAIAESNRELAKLKKQIVETQVKIETNQEAIGDVLAQLHMIQDISPLERLAGSENLAAFIDEETNLTSMQSSLNATVKKVRADKVELENKQVAVEEVLEDQKEQEKTLIAKEKERADLLAQTQGKEENYKQLAKQNNARIEQLREEQRQANLAAMQSINVAVPGGIAGGGGYPGKWANAPINAFVDPWGMYSRQCVSYTAWKVWSTGRRMPYWGGRGNANQWPSSARADGIATGSTPKVGSVAVWYIGYYGHVMYVEAVHDNGTITVSDYNLAWDGLYRKYNRSSAGLEYVYF